MRWWHARRQAWHEAVFWALDLETTGLNPRVDRILSVGLLPLRRGSVRWGERLYTVVRGASEVSDPGALAVHQILPADTDCAPHERDVLDRVLQRLSGGVLLAHCARVELGFLKAAARRHRLRWPAPAVVDTMRLLSRLERRLERLQPYPLPLPRALAAARARLGLPPHREHHALADALATAELFLVLRSRLDLKTLHSVL